MTDEQKANEINAQQMAALRESLLNGFKDKYRDLINYILKLPIYQQSFKIAIENLDTGMLWVQEIIRFGQIVPPTPPAAPTPPISPPAEAQKEDNQAVTQDHNVH